MRTADWPFLSLFSSHRNRKLYYLGKEDFYQTRNALNVASSFNFHKDVYQENHGTTKDIRFYGLSFGKSKKEVTRVFGKPNFVQKKGLPLSSQITLFYKFSVKGMKCILQLHLYNDKLFFCQIQLRNADNNIREGFLNLFRTKYQAPSLNWNETIEDEVGSKIALKDDVVPKVNFFSNDKELWKEIKHELNEQASKTQNEIYNKHEIALKWI